MVSTFKVDKSFLASTHVGTPDPRKACPPCGQLVLVEWWVPHNLLGCSPKIRLTLVYHNMTEEVIEHPIKYRIGYFSHEILGEDFNKTEGLLSYKTEVVTGDGEVFRESVHQLFVNLIQLDNTGQSEERMSSSVE